MFDVMKEILISKKEFTETNYKILQKSLVYIKSNLVDSDGGMHLTFDSLIEVNNITIGSNHITWRKVNVKPYGFDKIYLNKKSIEDKLYQKIDRFNERKIATSKFY